MDVLNFFATVTLITVSGALAPGPLFFATLSHGAKSGARSGFVFSVAHTFVEFTLVMLLALGFLTATNTFFVKLIIGVAGGAVLLIFGALQVRNAIQLKSNDTLSQQVGTRNLFLVGTVLTGLNPFFIVWWLTIGANLILLALEFASLVGVVFMYIFHVWIDYVWLTLIAHFSKMGTNIIGWKGYRIIMAISGGVLFYFGLLFLVDSLGPVVG